MDELTRIVTGHSTEGDAFDEPLQDSSLFACDRAVVRSPPSEKIERVRRHSLSYLFVCQSENLIQRAADGVKFLTVDDPEQFPTR